jgi:hypothetical protein
MGLYPASACFPTRLPRSFRSSSVSQWRRRPSCAGSCYRAPPAPSLVRSSAPAGWSRARHALALATSSGWPRPAAPARATGYAFARSGGPAWAPGAGCAPVAAYGSGQTCSPGPRAPGASPPPPAARRAGPLHPGRPATHPRVPRSAPRQPAWRRTARAADRCQMICRPGKSSIHKRSADLPPGYSSRWSRLCACRSGWLLFAHLAREMAYALTGLGEIDVAAWSIDGSLIVP